MRQEARSASKRKIVDHKSFSLERPSRKSAQPRGGYTSTEKFSRSPYMSSVNDLREELLKTKKAHSMVLRDNALMRTKLRIAEKECKRKEKEIGGLLSSEQPNTSKYQDRLEINSLKKRVLQLERALRSKIEENEYLLCDRNVGKAAENRHMLEKLEIECDRLKNHLSQSIPEGEFLREKAQYMEIIDRLTEENMELRRILGEYEKNNKDNNLLIREAMNLDRDFQDSQTKNSRKQANHYRDALSALFNQRRSRSAVANRSNSGQEKRKPERKETSATFAYDIEHSNGLNSSIDSRSPSKRSTSNKVWRKAPPISVTIPTRTKPTSSDKRAAASATKSLAFRGEKCLDEERSVMELRTHKQPELPKMYRNMSSETTNSSDNQQAEVIVVNDEGVQSTFFIDENGHVLEEVCSDHDSVYELDANQLERISHSSDEGAANIKELNMEYKDAVNTKQGEEQTDLEDVFRSIQSHALRVKMLGIRRDTLKRSSKQL